MTAPDAPRGKVNPKLKFEKRYHPVLGKAFLLVVTKNIQSFGEGHSVELMEDAVDTIVAAVNAYAANQETIRTLKEAAGLAYDQADLTHRDYRCSPMKCVCWMGKYHAALKRAEGAG